MWKEFKAFIVKGNVMDLAVAVIIGLAFGKIVTSLVDDIIMPIIGVITGGIDFSGLSFTIGKAAIKYGSFINNIINFIIIAIVVFLLVKAVTSLNRKPAPQLKDPVTKVCPRCYTEIPIKASRCPNCTSELTAPGI